MLSNEEEVRIAGVIERFRSPGFGRYMTSDGFLRVGNRFSILGVFCDQYVQLVGDIDWRPYKTKPAGDGIEQIYKLSNEDVFLPSRVQAYFGFRTSDASFIQPGCCGMMSSLVRLTQIGRPPYEVASLIESRPEGMFV